MFVPVPECCETRDIDPNPIVIRDTPILALLRGAVNVCRGIEADINADFFPLLPEKSVAPRTINVP
jgi:hypothetical protein